MCWKDTNTVPHGQSSAPLCSHQRSRQHQDQRAAPHPRLWTRLQKPESHLLPLHTHTDTTGLWRRELTLGKRLKHDEGRSSLQRKFYIAYDLLSGNIKQFKQPTLNHSDSSLHYPQPSACPPPAPPDLPPLSSSLAWFQTLAPPVSPGEQHTRVHTHAQTQRAQGPEAGGWGGEMSCVSITETRTSHFPAAVTPPRSPLRSVPVLFGTAPGPGRAPSHAQPGTTCSTQHL